MFFVCCKTPTNRFSLSVSHTHYTCNVTCLYSIMRIRNDASLHNQKRISVQKHNIYISHECVCVWMCEHSCASDSRHQTANSHQTATRSASTRDTSWGGRMCNPILAQGERVQSNLITYTRTHTRRHPIRRRIPKTWPYRPLSHYEKKKETHLTQRVYTDGNFVPR